MKIRDAVYLFQDGKLCRGLLGSVVRTRYNDVLVQTVYEGQTIQKWFKRHGSTRCRRDWGALSAYLTETPTPFAWYTCVSERDLKRLLGELFTHYHQIASKNSFSQSKKG